VLDAALLWFLPAISISLAQLTRMLVGPAASLLILAVLSHMRATRFDNAGTFVTVMLDRLVVMISGILFLHLGWIALRLFNHLTMALGFPYADGMLLAADGLLGLNWNAYFDLVMSRPRLMTLMDWSYQSLTLVSGFAFLLLIALGEVKRSRFFLDTFLVTAIVCSSIGFLFPAEAAVKILIGGPEMFPGMAEPPGLYHLGHLDNLRSGLPLVLNLNSLPGLVTVPSFHTAAGIILIWSFRQTVLFVPVTAYSLVMISATPVLGGHYFIDLIAGTLVALAVLVLFQRRARYRDLFHRSVPALAPGREPA